MAARQQLHRLALVALAALLLLSALVALPAQAAAPSQQVCSNLVINGGFETPSAWVLVSSPLPPAYTTSQPFTGARAMQIGNVNPATATVQAYSSVRQPLTIPANALSAELTFWVWTSTEANPGSDRQEALLLVPGASVQSASPTTVWTELSNSGAYRQIRVSVTGQIGRTVDLTFSVYNDGFGGRTWMLVDDVALVVCIPSGTATPTTTPTFVPVATATPTPTPTSLPTPVVPSPIPPTCVDIVANGGFEWDGAWLIGQAAIPPFYAGPPNPVYSDSRSMALGAVLASSPSNVASYSSIQQAVTLPSTAQTAQIRFWYYPNSNAAAGGFNRQELILLDPLRNGQTIEVLWRVTQNNNAWVYNEIDLTRFLGRTLTIYFNARNAGDGTRTGMYLDQVQVLACNTMGVIPAAVAEAGSYVWPEGQAPGAAVSEAAIATAVALTGPTVVAVGTNAAPRPEVTPETTPVSATATPESNRRDRQPIFDFNQLDSPWLIILVISGVVLLAVVLALLFFRGDQPQAPPP